MAKNTISLIIGIFLLISQFLLIQHGLDHLAMDDTGEICEFCIAAHGLASSLTGGFTIGAIVTSFPVFPVPDSFPTWVEPPSMWFARGPPAFFS